MDNELKVLAAVLAAPMPTEAERLASSFRELRRMWVQAPKQHEANVRKHGSMLRQIENGDMDEHGRITSPTLTDGVWSNGKESV